MKRKSFIIKAIILILLIFALFILLAEYAGMSFANKIYVYVDDSNRETVEILAEEGGIEIDGTIVRIGRQQMLGDWNLFIKYEDGSGITRLLDDGCAVDLSQYIIENGTLGGHAGDVVRGSILVVFAALLLYVVYLSGSRIRKDFKHNGK